VIDRSERAIGGDKDVFPDYDSIPSIDNHTRIDKAIPADPYISYAAGRLYLDKRIDRHAILHDNLGPSNGVLDIRERRYLCGWGD